MESKKQLKLGASSSNSTSNISVLIVDDNAMIRLIHKTMLKSLFNIESYVAKNGKEAVDLYCSGINFDIIFMDKEMPIMDGVEATKELRAMGVKSMIVGITVEDKDKEEFLAAGLNHCFEKPITRAAVELVLQEL